MLGMRRYDFELDSAIYATREYREIMIGLFGRLGMETDSIEGMWGL